MNKLPCLTELLRYKNQAVIERFIINNPNEAVSSEPLFHDMLRYLWLCEKHRVDCARAPDDPALQFIPVMHQEMRVIDQMWHEFILLTRDYHDFCHHYFGHFLHHEPNMRTNLAYSQAQLSESLYLFLNYTYDTLGEETLSRWFAEHLYP